MEYIYLHGFCSGANSYKGSYMRKRFAEKGIELQTPDLNGDDFSTLTLSRQLKQLEQLISKTSGRVTLMGSSMGAFLAALMAERTEKIEKLVLLAPAFRFAARYIDRLDPEILQNWREKGYIEVFHYAYAETRRLNYDIVNDARQYDDVSFQKTQPTLLLHGIHDDSVPYSLSIAYMQQNNQASLVLLNTDHQMTDSVEAIWKHISLFLDM
ncbi:MAG: YqiA/YcfP family alpha/beta fold hydrolase [Calditrichia bacterium]